MVRKTGGCTMSSDYDFITMDGKDVFTITLNRPEIHNPFDEKMIAELTDCFSHINPDARAVIITGAGKSFCAGADLNWMKRMGQYSHDQNLADAEKLSVMFKSLEAIPIPTVAKVNGSAFGGGAGLVCACDIAIASEEAKFGFSEVRLGLLPGVISPYVLDRIGSKKAAMLFMTGERLKAKDARMLGLVDIVVAPEELDKIIEETVSMILSGGPEAVKACKRLARTGAKMPREEFRKFCISEIANARASPEGKEGVGAFLEKREPSWRK
jgi:methylglutaconyl-CoA hydratase